MSKPLTGIINLDKPSGVTSHDVVAAVRRLFGQRKVGHAGTLDPMATGVLVVCLGDATRVSEYLMNSTKTYLATILLGISTTTDDAQGEAITQAPVRVTDEQIHHALSAFVGQTEQVPPRYAAIKVRGKKLYELARQGIEIEVPPRAVTIHSIRVAGINLPEVEIEVRCGPGTYIRALARDVGQRLGCGAHLSALRRTQSGQFRAQDATTLPQLERALASQCAQEMLVPLDTALARFPAIHLSWDDARRLASGQPVDGCPASALDAGAGPLDLARAYAPGDRFVAVVALDPETGCWRPRKVFVQPHELAFRDPQESDHAGH